MVLAKSASELGLLKQMVHHPAAPKWNFHCTDRMTEADLAAYAAYKERLVHPFPHPFQSPPDWLLDWVKARRRVVPLFQAQIPVGYHLALYWHDLPTTCRNDLATRVEYFLPEDEPLDSMVMYATSGTTGHPILIPKTPFAVSVYHACMEVCLARRGIDPDFRPDVVSNFLLCDQAHTVVYAALLSCWQNSGHAKINLHPNGWRTAEDRTSYLTTFDAPLLTGDPLSFEKLLHLALPLRPKAFFSTALALSPALENQLIACYQAPIFNWYAANEVGPIAYACPHGHGFHLLTPDVWIEILDDAGNPLPMGEVGEITVSGGSNPYLPLLRYRTGDFAALSMEACSCGDPNPRLDHLSGRAPARFYAATGNLVNQVDIAKRLRGLPIAQYQFYQQEGGDCELRLRLLPHQTLALPLLQADLSALFGGFAVKIFIDATLGEKQKIIPYQSAYKMQ